MSSEMKQIKELLRQNQKIIRFASQSLGVENLDEETLKDVQMYNNNLSTFQMDIDEFRSTITEYGDYVNQSMIQIVDNGIRLCVKQYDATGGTYLDDVPTAVAQLNSELTIDGNAITVTTKQLIVDTQNFKLDSDGNVTLSGEVHGDSCVIGGFTINGDTMTGNSDSTILSGTITANNMTLGNATTNHLYLNPGNVSNKNITMTSCKSLDTDEKEYTNTEMASIMNVIGDVKVTNGWDDSEHGTMTSISMATLQCSGNLYLSTSASSSGIHLYNRAYCYDVESTYAGGTWSDERLKHSIKDIDTEKCLELWENIRPVTFTMRKSGSHATGYIAQELLKVLEDADLQGIVTRPDTYYAVGYIELQAFRIKQIQENQKKIERLRHENR